MYTHTRIALVSSICFFLVATSLSATQPPLPRNGVNIAPNPTFDTGVNWDAGGPQVAYDAAMSHDGVGTGSMRLALAYLDAAGTDYIVSAPIPVIVGDTYTFATYLRSDTWPPPAVTMKIAWYYYHSETSETRWDNPELHPESEPEPELEPELERAFQSAVDAVDAR